MSKCERCDGSGLVVGWVESHPYQEQCPDCYGLGEIGGDLGNVFGPQTPEEIERILEKVPQFDGGVEHGDT